jgi:excinuclease ABC subunit A
LYARIGTPYCIDCGKAIKKLSSDEIVATIWHTVEEITGTKNDKKIKGSTDKQIEPSTVMGVQINKQKLMIAAPVVVGRKGEYYQMLYDMLGKGYEKAIIDGKVVSLRERVELKKNDKHNIDIVIDEFFVTEFSDDAKGTRERVSEAIERSLHESGGLVKIALPNAQTGTFSLERVVSAKFMCSCGFSFPEVEPRLFSFNSPYGACDECKGLGTKEFFDFEPCEKCHGARLRQEALHVRLGTDAAPPAPSKKYSGRLSPQPDYFLGTSDAARETANLSKKMSGHEQSESEDFFEKGFAGGSALPGMSIVQVASLSIENAKKFFDELDLSDQQMEIASGLIKEITARIQFMLNVGIEYLTLDRRANTLSGGEAQRIRLASQLGSGLVGALYVLDEPTIGLHQRDNDRLIKTLKHLKNLGNTVLVVEHDEDTIYAADYIVDIGPGAGVHGGKVVVQGYLDELLTTKKNPSGSATLAYLRDEKRIEIPEKRREKEAGKIIIQGATKFNLKNVNVDIPLSKFVCITGVSGSGKSTFLYDILHQNLRARFDMRYRTAHLYNVSKFAGTESLARMVLIDQSPIGRTPRSNPATYTGAFNHIRDLFTMTPEAKARGWKPGRFSFNVPGGRCEACQGNGLVAVEMHFLPTVYVTCDVCNGKRFMKETLEVTYKKKSIHDILEMTVEEGRKFFDDIPVIADKLQALLDVGLGYIKIGQSATTLSGGEAQRVKIASELFRPNLTRAIYLLDEPTVGLHYEDVKKLIEILQKLVDKGNTVVVIEHNLDLIKCSDYIIDLGPEGGIGGGTVVAKGTPEEVAKSKQSHTGHYLSKVLRKK